MAEQAKKAGDGQGREARIPMRKLTPARFEGDQSPMDDRSLVVVRRVE